MTPLVCTAGTRDLLVPVLAGSLIALAEDVRPQGDGDGVGWTHGAFEVSLVDDSARLRRDTAAGSTTVVMPLAATGRPHDAASVSAEIARVHAAALAALSADCDEARMLRDGIEDLLRDAAATLADDPRWTWVAFGHGFLRPDSLRRGVDERVQADEWQTPHLARLSSSPFRYHEASALTGTHAIVPVHGSRNVVALADLDPVETMRRLAALPPELRNAP